MENKIRKSYQKIKPTEGEKGIMLHRIKEELSTGRKHRSHRKIAVAACLCFGIFAASGTTYAAYRYMTTSEVATELDEPKLSKYFGKTQSEVKIQENDEYRAIYIGEVTGKNLSKDSDEQNNDDDESTAKIDENATYIVTALERKDGNPIELDESVITTPFVKGVRPWQYNIYFMNNSAAITMKRGNTLYSLTYSGDIEIFADRGVYIAMTDNAPSADSYSYDEKTGEIAPVKDYKGMNFLFIVDLDKSRADSEKADRVLNDSLDEQNGGEETTNDDSSNPNELSTDDYDRLTDEIISSGTLVYTEKLKLGKDNSYQYKVHDKTIHLTLDSVMDQHKRKTYYNDGREIVTMGFTKKGKRHASESTLLFLSPDKILPDEIIYFVTFQMVDEKFVAREYKVDGLYEKYASKWKDSTGFWKS